MLCFISGPWTLGYLFPWVSAIVRHLLSSTVTEVSRSSFMRKWRRDTNSFARQLCFKLWPKEDWDHRPFHPMALTPTWRRSPAKLRWKLPLSSIALTSYCQVMYLRWEDIVLPQERQNAFFFFLVEKFDLSESVFSSVKLELIFPGLQNIISCCNYFETINLF